MPAITWPVKKASLHRRARDIYKAGPLRSARALFGASSPTDLITRYRYLQRMADADRSLLDRVRELERRLTAESALLEEHLTEVSRLRLEGLQEAARLGAEEAEREAVVATFRNREGGGARPPRAVDCRRGSHGRAGGRLGD